MSTIYTRVVDDFVLTELQFYLFGEGSPQVFITGGIHGGEATGIYVAQRMIKLLKENDLLRGSVKILPVANPPAFRRLERTSPYDNLDMNRIFPGTMDSSPTRAIASLIWEEAVGVDYLIDLHCCGLAGASYTLALWQDYSFVKELAEMLTIPRVVQSGGTRGQLFTDASDVGIPAVIIELPGGQPEGMIDLQAAEECCQALINFLRLQKMLPGEPVRPEPVFYEKLKPVTSGLEGAFIPAITPGSVISQHQVIGNVEEQAVHSPFAGVAVMVRPASYIFKGNPVASIAPLLNK